jgi:hypothetical protein
MEEMKLKDLPAKEGKHRWVVVTMSAVPVEQLLSPKGVDITSKDLVMSAVGCFDCETEWDPKLAHQDCDAPEEEI